MEITFRKETAVQINVEHLKVLANKRDGPYQSATLHIEQCKVFLWSCPYQTGHASNLFESLRNSRGDLIFSAL